MNWYVNAVVLKVCKRDAPLERNAGFLKDREVSMTEKATEQAKPEVVAKDAPKGKKNSKPKLSAATVKQLQELTAEINRIESLKADRLAIMRKQASNGVPIKDIAEATGYSVARARQLLASK
jgi:hypothetical protein